MKIRTPSHSTVVAYLALFVALGTGGAYAVDRITSKEIADSTIRSADLKNRKAVKGKDVKSESLGGTQIREASLDLPPRGATAGAKASDCNPTSESLIDCAVTTIDLPRAGQVLAIGTGGAYSEGSGGARAGCEVRVDDIPQGTESSPGEIDDNTLGGADNGFARTEVTQALTAGPHTVALKCRELDSDVRIATPTIAAIAVG